MNLRVCVLVGYFYSVTSWPTSRLTALNQPQQMCVCACDTYPTVRGALCGAEVTGWRTWGGQVCFLPWTHGTCRRRLCGVLCYEIWSSMSQHKCWALGPTLLSSVQLEVLDWPPTKTEVNSAGSGQTRRCWWNLVGEMGDQPGIHWEGGQDCHLTWRRLHFLRKTKKQTGKTKVICLFSNLNT